MLQLTELAKSRRKHSQVSVNVTERVRMVYTVCMRCFVLQLSAVTDIITSAGHKKGPSTQSVSGLKGCWGNMPPMHPFGLVGGCWVDNLRHVAVKRGLMHSSYSSRAAGANTGAKTSLQRIGCDCLWK